MVLGKLKRFLHTSEDEGKIVDRGSEEGETAIPRRRNPSNQRPGSRRRKEDLGLPSEENVKNLPEAPEIGGSEAKGGKRRTPDLTREERGQDVGSRSPSTGSRRSSGGRRGEDSPRKERRPKEGGRTPGRNENRPRSTGGNTEEMLEEILRKLDDIDRKLERGRRS
ncbi:MAG: hypothetical protein ACLFTQ_02475 [Candidatus Aenigmatarchaeota archaeon]